MKIKISDMMGYFEADTIDIYEQEIASAERIKEVTMKKVQDEKIVPNNNKRKIIKAAAIITVLMVSVAATGTSQAHLEWNGFALTAGMSEKEKAALEEYNIALMACRDSEGNLHYLNAEGEETKVLSEEEAAAYNQQKLEARKKALQESTKLLDVQSLEHTPMGITEMTTDEEGRFAEFALGNSYMVILRPEATDKYSLKKGDTVRIALTDEEDCILEFGMIKDSIIVEKDSVKSTSHHYVFNISEDGEYNFSIMYYSVNKGFFTDCMIVIE